MNKTTKLKWLTLLCAIFIIGSAVGFLSGQTYQKFLFQKHRRNEQGQRPNMIENLNKELNLSEEQSKKISEILDKQRQQMQGEFKSVREKFKSIREEVVKEIESVLTEEQKVKYAEYRAKREKERRRRWSQDTTISISTETTIKKEK